MNITPNPSAWVGSPTTLLSLENIDPIVQVFDVFGIPPSPKNLRQFVLLLAEPTRPEKRHLWEKLTPEEVKGVLARTIQRRAIADKSPVVGLDGVRWFVDEKMLRSFPSDTLSILVYTVADPDIRFNRVVSAERDGHAGEKGTSREEFDTREKANNEIYIPQIGSRADYVIKNNGTREELREKVEELYEAKIKPAIALLGR
jgi:dephospho-CoA kinase